MQKRIIKKKHAEWTKLVEAEAKKLFKKDMLAARDEARIRAESSIPHVDVGTLRGRGPVFILEFTTVVVIIISAVILGVLGVLSTEQIGTLLAAIAGYVLGRATTRTTEGVTPSVPTGQIITPATPQQSSTTNTQKME